ncbi:MAG: AAA family ATPase [Campylobacterota bacterium]
MTLNEYEEKVELNKQNLSITTQIEEFIELFNDVANIKYSSYYKYDYEYNDFFYKFTINSDGELVKQLPKNQKKYRLLLRQKGIVFGYIEIYEKIKSTSVLKKLLEKIKKYLKYQRELEKKLSGSDISFNIYIFHDDDSEMFAKNLNDGLNGLFNVDVTISNSVKKYKSILRNKDTKHIMIFLVSDETLLKQNEKLLKNLNELIIVIGPNEHKLSIFCGRLGIQNYIPINQFRADSIKEIIVNTRNNLINKNKYGNRIIAVSGISGGIGTTTVCMNMADMLSQNLPNKNILYIDLSTTKAISNLFLEKNPLPQKTVVDLVNSSEFNLESNLENGLVKIRENFYGVTGIQKHIDKEYLQKDVFIEKLLEYISSSSDFFNFIIIDVGLADASNIKTTIYDIVNEIWLLTEMNLPHISKVKTFYSLMKRAGLKEKISFIVNRYDSQNAISVNDVSSILNMASGDKIQFDEYKIPNDYQTLGKCWNYCDLASQKAKNSLFIEKLDDILIKKEFYSSTKETKELSFFKRLFQKSK